MKRFFIITRGRTGSTAVTDSLNKSSNVTALQEPFIRLQMTDEERELTKDRAILNRIQTPRFDFWLASKKNVSSGLKNFFHWNKFSYRQYLDEMEQISQVNLNKAFGIKIISHHFKQRWGLKRLLLRRGYKAIYLTRNVPRQVISGMVANMRGKFNAHSNENYNDDAIYKIDIDKFRERVIREARLVAKDIHMLRSFGFEFIEVSYEDFVENPDTFFAEIFNFLDIPEEKLPESSYTIMIKDIRQVVQNYQEVEQCLAKMGMTIE